MTLPSHATESRRPDVDRVPTLTEVVELKGGASRTDGPAEVLAFDLHAEVAAQLDGVLEARVRDALAPALARVADDVVHSLCHELSTTLNALIDQAVARALTARDAG